MTRTLLERRLRRGIGRRLRRQRLYHGLSLDRLSREMRISKGHLSRVENGLADVTMCVLFRWTRALGCSVREFAQEVAALDQYRRRRKSPDA